MSKQVFDEYVQEYDLPLNRAMRSHRDTIDLIENTLIENAEGRVDQALTFDAELVRFYSAIERWKVTWKTNQHSPIELEGTFNILPIEQVLIGDVDFHPDEFPVMRNFTVVDYFYPEAGVGFYVDKPERGFFITFFDGDTKALNLDFKGYLQMLKYTKGVAYWQRIILNPEGGISERIIANMHRLFPEFTKEGFYELHDSVRISG